jgi:hypothetical protein
MKLMRRLATMAILSLAVLALAAGPAAAKKPRAAAFTYFATINCGAGPVEVGSGDDLWSPLVDLRSGKVYKPVAWHVSVGDSVLAENKDGEPKKHAVVCSYTDGVATGTVTVKKA